MENKICKVLIVENNYRTLNPLERIAREVIPYFYRIDLDISRDFIDAKSRIGKQSYNMVFLDNLGINSKEMKDIGYLLIPQIRKRNSKIIIIGRYPIPLAEKNLLPIPDYTISIFYDYAKKDFENILKRLNRESLHEI